MDKTPRFLAVDGSNLLFQMFFGMPSRIMNSDGRAIHGTLGFIGALRKMMILLNPTHVVVLFDGEHANPRVEIAPSYKSNRPDLGKTDESENPFSQLPDVYSALDFLGIHHAETEICEADDWMASYAMNYASEIEVILASFDSDLFQLITDRVSVFRYRGNSSVLCTPQFIRDKYGIEPHRYADLKALVGDSSDNIPGVPRVGPKTAAHLVNTYGGINDIIDNANSISRPSIRNSIMNSVELIRTNYRLIKLSANHTPPFQLHELSYSYNKFSTVEVLRSAGIMK